jgi:Flp pilus assembly pilin Flp
VNRLLSRLWSDDAGAVLAVEWTMLTGVLVAGLVPGFIAVRNALNATLYQTAAMVQSFAPAATVSGWQSPVAAIPGLAAAPPSVAPLPVPYGPVVIAQQWNLPAP